MLLLVVVVLEDLEGVVLALVVGAAAANYIALPADRFRHQLQFLYDMGFDDKKANLTALQLHRPRPRQRLLLVPLLQRRRQKQ